MKITLNRTDRCNKYTHAQGIYVKSIYRLLKLSIQNGNMRYMYTFIIGILLYCISNILFIKVTFICSKKRCKISLYKYTSRNAAC